MVQSTLECIRVNKKKLIPFLAEKTVCACVHKMALLIAHRVMHCKQSTSQTSSTHTGECSV